MESRDSYPLPEIDEWLAHIDTVVLGRKRREDIDPPVDDEPTARISYEPRS